MSYKETREKILQSLEIKNQHEFELFRKDLTEYLQKKYSFLLDYNTPIVKFAKQFLNFTPYWYQVVILNAALKFDKILVLSGRQIGKSTALAALALYQALNKPRYVISGNIDLLSPSESIADVIKRAPTVGIYTKDDEESTNLFNKLLEFIFDSPYLNLWHEKGYIKIRRTVPKSVNFTIKRWKDAKGYPTIIVRGIGHKGDAARGKTYDYLLIDEADFIPDDFFSTAFATQVSTNPFVLLSSTPNREGTFFHKILENPGNYFIIETFPSFLNPNYNFEKDKEFRQQYEHTRYLKEILGIYPEATRFISPQRMHLSKYSFSSQTIQKREALPEFLQGLKTHIEQIMTEEKIVMAIIGVDTTMKGGYTALIFFLVNDEYYMIPVGELLVIGTWDLAWKTITRCVDFMHYILHKHQITTILGVDATGITHKRGLEIQRYYPNTRLYALGTKRKTAFGVIDLRTWAATLMKELIDSGKMLIPSGHSIFKQQLIRTKLEKYAQGYKLIMLSKEDRDDMLVAALVAVLVYSEFIIEGMQIDIHALYGDKRERFGEQNNVIPETSITTGFVDPMAGEWEYLRIMQGYTYTGDTFIDFWSRALNDRPFIPPGYG